MTKKERIESLERDLEILEGRIDCLTRDLQSSYAAPEPKPKAHVVQFIGFEEIKRELEAMRILNAALVARVERLEEQR